ncbi:aquaporin-9 [Ambystoma mexicanum]|uniref:aquaporin-9 n=1 Tax=Ambystoma mexicanum TaxID=8296 RepID=UPI0037E7B582
MTQTTHKSLRDRLALKNSLSKEIVAEFLATFVLIVLGCGSVAQAVLSRGVAGNAVTINAGFAMAVTMAVYVAGGVSGGHVNPAISLAMCATGKMRWCKFPFYVCAQMLGAMAGAAAIFGIYYDAFMSFAEGTLAVSGPNATAHIFATYPASFLSTTNGFAEQVASTALLVISVFAIFDNKNIGVPAGLEPVVVGLLIFLLSCSLGMNSGCAMNPARDLGPRMFTAVAGWGLEVFTAGNNWWWVPVVAPMIGGLIGAYVYILAIELHHQKPLEDTKSEQEAEDGSLYGKYELTNSV